MPKRLETVRPRGPKTPVREIRTVLNDSGRTSYVNRIFVGTPSVGWKRDEWIAARYSQIIPMNWSQVQVNQYMGGYLTEGYPVDDAQNLIVRQCIEGDFEWLFLLEHDVVVPDNMLVMLDQYMHDAKIPIVSGLYFSRAHPSRPLTYRGRGTGVYDDWKVGDKIWVDGIPTGCLLIHHSILKLMWDESAEYRIRRLDGYEEITRRIFKTPGTQEIEGGMHNIVSGTSDLDWCDRVMKDEVIQRAGWSMDYCLDPRYPFLVDTNLFCRHVDMSTGESFP
jgi:hypothetical protein